jgi:hypothetical protein
MEWRNEGDVWRCGPYTIRRRGVRFEAQWSAGNVTRPLGIWLSVEAAQAKCDKDCRELTAAK